MVDRSWLPPSRIFSFVATSWLLGTVFPIFSLEVYALYLFIGLFAIILVAWPLTWLRCLLLCSCCYLAASLYFNQTLRSFLQTIPPTGPLSLTATILERPKVFDNQLRYTARIESGRFVYINTDRQSLLPPGTQLAVKGKFKPATEFHHYKDRVIGQISQPTVTATTPAHFTGWEHFLVSSRERFSQTIKYYFTEPDASLYAGIIAGVRSDIPQTILDTFATAGLTHIIAVSGFNVTVLVSMLARVTRRLGRHFHLLVSLAAISSFVIFTGGSASVVRAGCLASLFIIARTIGRVGSISRVLLVVACCMSLANPLIVRYDIGFQLSFLAVIGLAFFATPVQQILIAWRLPPWLAESIAATTAAQITTLPIMLHYFQTLGIYSVLANVLVEPFIPLITLSGPPFFILSSLFEPFGVYISIILSLSLRYILFISRFISSLPNANVALENIPLYLLALYYFAIFGVVSIKGK